MPAARTHPLLSVCRLSPRAHACLCAFLCLRGCLYVSLCVLARTVTAARGPAAGGGRGQVRVSNKAEYEALMDRAAYDKYLEETAH